MHIQDTNVQITFEDQSDINTFARYNAKLQDARDEMELKKKELQNLEDASEELVLLEADDTESGDGCLVPFQIGEVFVGASPDKVGVLLDEAKEGCKATLSKLEAQVGEYKQKLSELKIKLYAKFGDNINLENEEE